MKTTTYLGYVDNILREITLKNDSQKQYSYIFAG
jgi:hypothetical protein